MTIQEFKMLTKDELASLLSISIRTLQRKLDLGEVPAPLRIGKSVRWVRSQIEEWILAGCPKNYVHQGGK
jgi:excisionase family DNA binding protein